MAERSKTEVSLKDLKNMSQIIVNRDQVGHNCKA